MGVKMISFMLYTIYFNKEMHISYSKSFEKLDEVEKIVQKIINSIIHRIHESLLLGG